jgi:parvulin-like peptidyl-prolyl isomerase
METSLKRDRFSRVFLIVFMISSVAALLLSCAKSDNRGRIVIRSEPPGAAVRLGGNIEGITPYETPIAPGMYSLKIVKEGYLTVTDTLSIRTGQDTTLFYKLFTPEEKGVIGEVFGRYVYWMRYNALLREQLSAAMEQRGIRKLSEYQEKSIRDQVWDSIVNEMLLEEEIKRLNLRVTDKEIVRHLRDDPPEFIRNQPSFQTDGRFDFHKYHLALNDPKNYQAFIPIENYLRQTIPVEKLQRSVIDSVRLSEEEIREAYALKHEKVKANILVFSPGAMVTGKTEPSNQEIEDYYQIHKEDFFEPENRRIEYVTFPLTPSGEDSAAVYSDAEYLLEELDQGASFEELAREFSEDENAENGGDLGFFSRGTMVKPFEDAAFSARAGDIVGPVKTEYGLHLIKVLDRRKAEGKQQVRARHIMLTIEPGNETIGKLHDKARSLYETVQGADRETFRTVAEKRDLRFQETPYFPRRDFVPGIGMSPYLANKTFIENPGYIGGPVTIGEAIVVYRIADVRKAHIPPLEQVREEVKKGIKQERKKEKAAQLCRETLHRVRQGTPLRDIRAGEGIRMMDTDYFTKQSRIPEIGREPELSEAAFRLNTGEVSEPVITERAAYLVQVTAHQPVDEDAFQAVYGTFTQKTLEAKQQKAVADWLDALRDRAEIKDYRWLYFH